MKGPLAAALLAVTTLSAMGALAAEASPTFVYRDITAAPQDKAVSAPSGIQLTTGQDDSSVSIKFGRTRSFMVGPKATFVTLGGALSTPLDSEADRTGLATLNGLADASAFSVNYSRATVSLPVWSDPRAHAESELSFCKDVADAFVAQAVAAAMARSSPADLTAASNAAAGSAREKLDGAECDAQFVADFAPDRLTAFQKLHWGERPTVRVWGLSGKVGRTSYDYFDAGTLAAHSVDKTGWSVKAYYAIRPLQQPWLVTFGAEYAESYDAQDKAILCPGGGGVVTCINGPVGAPEQSAKEIVSAEYRRALGSMSFSVGVEYDAKADVFSVQAPLYIMSDDDGALTGGIAVGWRSDTDDVSASVFVGKAFSLGLP